MEVIEKEIPYTRPDLFRIYPIGDIHAGSIHCVEDKIKAKVKTISEDEHAYIIGTGDWAECITKDDKRFDMAGLASWVKRDDIAESQRKWIVELFRPVKDKILCLLTGNHEETIRLHHQNDITRHICDDLGVAYGGYSCFLNLKFVRNGSYSFVLFHVFHGAGAAVTEGARIQRLKRLIDTVTADIYLMGHLHSTGFYAPEKIELRNHKIKSIHKFAVITGSWVTAYSQGLPTSYAERLGYPPSKIGCPCVILNPDKDIINVEF